MDGLIPLLPHVNASLNALATLLLLIGYVLIRRRRERAHRRVMLACFAVSVVFLACYLTYHANTAAVNRFPAYPPAPVRWTYYFVLVNARRAGGGGTSARRGDDRDGPSRPPPSACAPGPLDAAHLAVRLAHRRAGVLDAVPCLPAGLPLNQPHLMTLARVWYTPHGGPQAPDEISHHDHAVLSTINRISRGKRTPTKWCFGDCGNCRWRTWANVARRLSGCRVAPGSVTG